MGVRLCVCVNMWTVHPRVCVSMCEDRRNCAVWCVGLCICVCAHVKLCVYMTVCVCAQVFEHAMGQRD